MIFIGTTNPGKVAEIAALLAPLGVELKPVSLDIEEPAETFEENARLKALAYAEHTGGVTISEDSGLIIPALEGLPGVWSARFADLDVQTRKVTSSGRSREVIDRLNNQRVLELMQGIEQPRRAALFKVALLVAQPGKVLFQSVAECHGWIAEEEKGTGGFGYDPIFVGQDTFGKTFAELDPMRKNLRSHRKRALDEMFLWASQNRSLL
ncbi:MAG: non-canonical purine NTP pyrophosphatase [Blastocatellia bacterium]|nr:non-canonical purine NTP pyrophosphatase [Blastocatellia bacterium]